MQVAVVERVSTAAKGLCVWLHAMYVYHKVAKVIPWEVKRERLAQAMEKGLRGDMCGTDMCGATRSNKSTRPGLALDFTPWDKRAGEGPRTRPRERAPRLRNEWRRSRRHPPARRRRGECARLGHVLGELQVLLPDRRRTTNASPGPGENYEAPSRRLTENSS